MKINCIVGIDPGAAGGITVWRPNNRPTSIKMPRDINDFREYIEYIKSISSPLVFVEKLNIRPDDVTVENEGANLGKLYRVQRMLQNFEQLKAVLTVMGVPFVLVNPMKWQNELKLRIKGKREEKAERKRRYKDIAANLYPEITATLWNADATLIMHFGRYILRNDPGWVLQNLPQNLHGRLF